MQPSEVRSAVRAALSSVSALDLRADDAVVLHDDQMVDPVCTQLFACDCEGIRRPDGNDARCHEVFHIHEP